MTPTMLKAMVTSMASVLFSIRSQLPRSRPRAFMTRTRRPCKIAAGRRWPTHRGIARRRRGGDNRPTPSAPRGVRLGEHDMTRIVTAVLLIALGAIGATMANWLSVPADDASPGGLARSAGATRDDGSDSARRLRDLEARL